MAMTAAGLATAITTAQGAAPTGAGQAIQNAANLALATAIVTYIQANAVVITATPGAMAGVATLPGTGTVG